MLPTAPEHSDREVLCDQPNLPRTPGGCHTHPQWLTQSRTNLNWDQQEELHQPWGHARRQSLLVATGSKGLTQIPLALHPR